LPNGLKRYLRLSNTLPDLNRLFPSIIIVVQIKVNWTNKKINKIDFNGDTYPEQIACFINASGHFKMIIEERITRFE